LSAETCHEFIEWCGLVDGQDRTNSLEVGARLYKNELYYNFIGNTLIIRREAG
jgi:hypothetical protein